MGQARLVTLVNNDGYHARATTDQEVDEVTVAFLPRDSRRRHLVRPVTRIRGVCVKSGSAWLE